MNAKNIKPAKIHRQLVDVSGENLMTDVSVRKWGGGGEFNDGWTNVQAKHEPFFPMKQTIFENIWITIKMLCNEFPHN